MMRVQQLVARTAALAAAQAPRVALSTRTARVHLPLQLVAGFASQSGAGGAGGRKKQPQSFAIAEAFEGLDDNDDNDDDDESGGRTRSRRASSSSSESDATREFHAAMEKKKRWLQSLAQQRQFAVIVKAVDDCYAPLYALPGAAPLRATRALLTRHFDAQRVVTKFQPQLFSDTLARTTEQEALALLVIAREGALARAVFAHRRALAAGLADTHIVLPDTVGGSGAGAEAAVTSASVMDDALLSRQAQPLDLSSHFRSFYSWGMGAYSLASDYGTIFALYDDALAAGVYPTASMHATYVKALVSARRPARDVRAFYETVTAARRPTNIFFYRELLFFASVQHDTALLLELLEAMKRKGFKLRADDYVLAIKAFDDQYYLTRRTVPLSSRRLREASSSKTSTSTNSNPDEPKLTTPLDTYATCVARLQQQEEHPEQFEDLDAAAHSVLALFDEMVHDERLAPRSAQLYPRVITAAVYAREFARALTFVELFDQHCRSGAPAGQNQDQHEKPTLHHAGVRMAVNALLLLDEPERAWALVQSECGPAFEQPRDFAHVANIVEYLCRQRGDSAMTAVPQLLALLRDAQTLQLLPRFSNSTVKLLLPALVRSDAATLSDEQLWTTVCAFESVFRVRAKPHAYAQFLNECAFRQRVGAAKRALKQRDERRVGKLKARLALRLAGAFADAGDDAAVPELLAAVDAAAAKPEELADLSFAVIRANARLGRSRDDSTRVFAMHVAPLVASGKLSAEHVPADVAAIVA